jgi:hypothetical protein
MNMESMNVTIGYSDTIIVDDPDVALPFILVYNKILAEIEHNVAMMVKITLYADHL